MDDVFDYSRMIALWFTTFFLLLLRYFKVVQTKQNKKKISSTATQNTCIQKL